MFNNAGIGGGELLIHETPEEVFDRIVAVDLKAVWLGIKHAVPVMMEPAAARSSTRPRCRRSRHEVSGRVWRGEGRCRSADAGRGDRIRRVRHPRECDPSRRGAHAAGLANPALARTARSRTRRSAAGERRSRCAAPASRSTSRMPHSGLRATSRASSPALRSWSTAAGPLGASAARNSSNAHANDDSWRERTSIGAP